MIFKGEIKILRDMGRKLNDPTAHDMNGFYLASVPLVLSSFGDTFRKPKANRYAATEMMESRMNTEVMF